MRPLTAADVMTPEVLCVRDDMSLAELSEFLTEHEISGAPVQDGDGNLVGVVSVTDVALAAAEETSVDRNRSFADYYVRGWEDKLDPSELDHFQVHDSGRQVREFMTPVVYSVREDTSVSELAEMMIDAHVHRLLVTRDGKLMGIVSSSDLLGLLIDRD